MSRIRRPADLHDRRRRGVRISRALPRRPRHRHQGRRLDLRRLWNRGCSRRLVLRRPLRSVGTAPCHRRRPRNLAHLSVRIPQDRTAPSDRSLGDDHLRPARLRLSALRLRVPRLDHGRRSARKARHRRWAGSGLPSPAVSPPWARWSRRYSIPRFGAYSTFWLASALVSRRRRSFFSSACANREAARRLVERGQEPLHARCCTPSRWPGAIRRSASAVSSASSTPRRSSASSSSCRPSSSRSSASARTQCLTLLSAIFFSNIIWNLLFGLIGDRLGWRRTVAICGGFGSAISTLLLFYVPLATHSYAPALASACSTAPRSRATFPSPR